MPLLLSSKPAGASEEGGGSEAKAKATPTIAAAMKVLMVFPPPLLRAPCASLASCTVGTSEAAKSLKSEPPDWWTIRRRLRRELRVQ